MKKVKKMSLVVVSIIILVVIASISLIFLNTREKKTHEKLEPDILEMDEKKEEVESDIKVTDEEDTSTEIIEEQQQDNVSPSPNNNTSSDNSSNDSNDTSSTSNNNNSSNSNINHNSNSIATPSTPPVQSEQPQEVVPEPSCIPKKFYTVFRADFDSMEMCQQIGEQYQDRYGYYGFICDYDMDDCGTTYYMLTMFDGNGNYIDYPNIPKP